MKMNAQLFVNFLSRCFMFHYIFDSVLFFQIAELDA